MVTALLILFVSFQGSLNVPKASSKRLPKTSTKTSDAGKGGGPSPTKWQSPNSCRRIFGRPNSRGRGDKPIVLIEKVSQDFFVDVSLCNQYLLFQCPPPGPVSNYKSRPLLGHSQSPSRLSSPSPTSASVKSRRPTTPWQSEQGSAGHENPCTAELRVPPILRPLVDNGGRASDMAKVRGDIHTYGARHAGQTISARRCYLPPAASPEQAGPARASPPAAKTRPLRSDKASVAAVAALTDGESVSFSSSRYKPYTCSVRLQPPSEDGGSSSSSPQPPPAKRSRPALPGVFPLGPIHNNNYPERHGESGDTSNSRAFECSLCNKRFSTKGGLAFHEQNGHVSCKLCGKKFNSVWMRAKAAVCRECSRRYV